MARRELFDISKSSTLRSLRASAAISLTDLVGLIGASGGGDRLLGDSIEVSMDGRTPRAVSDGLDKEVAFCCCASGEGVARISAVVAERRRD